MSLYVIIFDEFISCSKNMLHTSIYFSRTREIYVKLTLRINEKDE